MAKSEESEAGPVISFVNQIADAVRDEFPDRYIGTLAYQYTRKAPKTLVPRDNVAVRLCSIECSFSEPLDSGSNSVNDRFVEDINAWNKKTDNLFIWDYVTNFSHYVQPFPNLRSLKPNIRFFIDHGVKGLFEQGNYNGSGGGEMAELRNYLLARFLWNPDRDLDTEMNEFLEAFYGPAAKPIRDYIDFAHDHIRNVEIHTARKACTDNPPTFFHGGIPGLINAHHHLYSTFARGFTPPGPPARNFEQNLKNLWWKLDAALDSEDVYFRRPISRRVRRR